MLRPIIVAVIDDSPQVIDFVAAMLEDEGYQVAAWQTGAGAHAFLRAVMPAVVILDMRMETPDAGLTVLEAIRDDPATHALPVTLSSVRGSYLAEQAERLAALGCALLPKPYRADDLLAAVERAIADRGARARTG